MHDAVTLGQRMVAAPGRAGQGRIAPTERDYASVISRGIAFVLDALVAVIVATLGFELVVAILSTIGTSQRAHNLGVKSISLQVAIPVVFVLYCAIGWSLSGRTPGMALLGLRVIRRDGGTPGPFRSLVRAVAYWVSAILMLGFIWIAFDGRRQGFHDKIAGTFVIYDWPERRRRKMAR